MHPYHVGVAEITIVGDDPLVDGMSISVRVRRDSLSPTRAVSSRRRSARTANLRASPHVLVLAGDAGWDRGLDVAVEGAAVPVTDDALLQRLTELYRDRWDGRWQLDVQNGAVTFTTPDVEVVAFEVTPRTARSHAKGDPFSQTTYRF